MSMIQSAQVFSPRPGQNAFQNLRLLQSPLKPFKSPTKVPSSNSNLQDVDEQEIVLVDGDSPRVVEEEKDLVILEDVEVDVQAEQQQATQYFAQPTAMPSLLHNTPRASFPPSMPQPLQTPRRRIPGEALHRAVLIRSAQRAVLKAEIEKEEEEEEKEVEEVIVTDGATTSSDNLEDGTDGGDQKMEDESEGQRRTLSRWRKSLESVRIWPFGSANPIPAQEDEEMDEDVRDTRSYQMKQATDEKTQVHLVDDESRDIGEVVQSTESTDMPFDIETPNQKRTLGNFMTPQANRKTAGGGRYSYGAVKPAGRIAREETWRGKDIVIPKKGLQVGIKEEEEEKRDLGEGRQRPRLTEEERKVRLYCLLLVCIH